MNRKLVFTFLFIANFLDIKLKLLYLMNISNIAHMSGRNTSMVGPALAECACVTQLGSVLARQ